MGLLTISTPPPEHEPPVPETDDVVLAEDSLLYEIAVHEQSRLRADVGDSPDAARIDGEHSVVARYREVRQADIRRRMTTYKYLIAAELIDRIRTRELHMMNELVPALFFRVLFAVRRDDKHQQAYIERRSRYGAEDYIQSDPSQLLYYTTICVINQIKNTSNKSVQNEKTALFSAVRSILFSFAVTRSNSDIRHRRIRYSRD